MTQTVPSKKLQIFKPGRHITMGGQALSFAESDLQATVSAYDPAVHEAPLVVGHPKADLPAYGWVQSLQFSEGRIDATPKEVNPDFADMVAAGAFKKISASFYAPDAPQNPVPGVYYLRHVGFLGAQAPSVKGLRSPSFAFSENEEGVVEFSEYDDVDNASLWRNLREWFISKFGMAEADQVIPGWTVKSIEQGAQDEVRQAQTDAADCADTCAQPMPGIPNFSESQQQESAVTEAEAAQLRTQMAVQAAHIAELEAAARKQLADATHAAHLSFCEGLKGFPKSAHEVIVTTLDHFAAQETTPEFGEGEARAPLLDLLKAVLAAIPAPVQFGEYANAARVAEQTVNFADAQSISDAATAYQAEAQGKGISMNHTQAVAVVTAKNR
jgi:hypothetical protein